MGRLPVLRVEAGEVPERVLVMGDPRRAELAAERLDECREAGRFREYVTFVGEYRGAEVAVSSHGVGAPGAAVCIDELLQAGARRIIRAGTCGGLQPWIDDGDLVIAAAAIREDGVTRQLVPDTFPAAASWSVVADLQQAAASASDARGVHTGIVLTHALFYPGDVLGSDLELWSKAGAVAVEMECAALFVLGALHSIQTGAVLVSDGNPLRPGQGGYDPHRSVVHDAVEAMIGIALDALVAG